MLLKLINLFGVLVGASVTVRKTSQGPTGYEVIFQYKNATASSVTIGGGLVPFTDSYHANPGGSARYDPHDYKPGWFPINGYGILPAASPYKMTNAGNGSWTYTAPFPSGTYTYAFIVDCPKTATCDISSGNYVVDPDVPPFQNVRGQQISSTFQVPFDPKFQYDPDSSLNFDYNLPVAKEHQGTVFNVNYTSPGSVFPASGIHDAVVYLPPGYSNSTSKKYPLLYLSHGGGGTGQDWENLARASQLFDNLILASHIPPTVVVMPAFYNIAKEYADRLAGGGANAVFPSAPVVRENYQKYLFPFIEKTFAVSQEPSGRAFAGLSLGGILTYEMYINATSYFSYFGIFSGATFTNPSSLIDAKKLAANPALAQKGIFTGVGLYDFAFDDIRKLEKAFQDLGIPFWSRVSPFGWHAWNTWQDNLWHFGKTVLWKKGLPWAGNPKV